MSIQIESQLFFFSVESQRIVLIKKTHFSVLKRTYEHITNNIIQHANETRVHLEINGCIDTWK